MRRALQPKLVAPLVGVLVCVIVASLLAGRAPATPLFTSTPAPATAQAPGPALRLSTARLAGVRQADLLPGLADEDEASRRKIVQRLMTATVADAPTLHELLHRRTGVSPEDYKVVLRAVGATVPDRLGRFAKEKEPSRETSESELDWLEALITRRPSSLRPALRAALPETALSVALMRALVSTRHPEASLSLLRFAYRHRGAFRDECGRQIRAMGVHAVPGLLRASTLKDPESYKMTRYAAYQLDRIDCARPDRALRQSDPDLRVEILHAYGEIRSPAAVSAVLDYTNDSVASVRRAARWALLRYVSGRPPKVIKRKLRLPGGKETDSERALYLTYRQLASLALVERLARELAAATPGTRVESLKKSLAEDAEPRFLAEKLFSHFDRKREESQEQELEQSLALSGKGNLDDALLGLDRILAADPYHPKRDAMAPLFYQKCRQVLTAGKLAEAEAFCTKAIHLGPGAAFVSDAKAYRALAGALADESMSAESEWKLRAALALKPDLAQADRALRLHQKRQQQRLWVSAGIAGGAAILVVLGLLLVRRRFSW